MQKTKVLIVDDSPLARDLIRAILSMDNELEVVGEAVNGIEAVEKVKTLKPNIVTMDIEMPVMDGLEAIEQIMAYNAVPILVVTTRGDAKTAYAAISKGALDLITKPDINLDAAHEFIDKIKMLSKIRVITHLGGKRTPHEPVKDVSVPVAADSANYRGIVAIASSTGGPDALSIILSSLPQSFPFPIVIAQHISDGFAPGMVEWLKTIARVDVRVGAEGEALLPGVAYISPSEKHMEVTSTKRLSLAERELKDIYRPSCDRLLSSAAAAFGKNTVGIILTGMGMDGVIGMKKIKDSGGITIAQDEATSVVFGMNKAAVDANVVDKVLPITSIADEIAKSVGRFAKIA